MRPPVRNSSRSVTAGSTGTNDMSFDFSSPAANEEDQRKDREFAEMTAEKLNALFEKTNNYYMNEHY